MMQLVILHNYMDLTNIFIPYDELRFKVSLKDSTLVCIEGGSGGKKVAYTDEEVNFGNKLCSIKAFEQNNKFFYYIIRSEIFKTYYSMSINGDRNGVSLGSIGNFILPLPPLAEQEQIAAYLDWKINEIDRLIAVEKEKIIAIEDIWEKVIDDSFEIFNSDELEKGVKLKNLVRQVTERSVERKKFIALENIISKKGKLKDDFKTLSDSTEGIAVKANMVIFGKLRPYLAKSIIVSNDANCSPEFLVLEPIELTPKYLKYMMLSHNFVDLVNSSTYGTKMPRANSEFILNLRVNSLNVEKQEELVRKLELLESKVEINVKNTQEIISHLESLKTSLISEVVTGKIDVRNVVIPSYEKVEVSVPTDEEEIEE